MKTILVAMAAFATVALLVGIVLSVPVENHARSAALGLWSAPQQVLSERVLLTDSCQQMLYAALWGNLIVSPDDGATWGSPITLDGTTDVDDYIMYRFNYSDEYPSLDMFFSKSFDNGTTWTSCTYVMTPDGPSDTAYRIFKLGPILICYAYVNAGGEGSINYSRSTDGGFSWRPQAYIDDKVHTEDPMAADIVSCQGKLFLAYDNYDTTPIEFYDVVVIESDNMGATWTNKQVVGDGWLPLIKEDSGNLYVTYWNYTTYNRLMFTMSDDAGATWTTPFEIGMLRGGGYDVTNLHALAVSGSQVFASYSDFDAGRDPQYMTHINYSDDGGYSWSDLGDVTGLDTNTFYPSLLISNGKLHFMFVDAGAVIGPDRTTFYRWLWLDAPIPEFSIMLVPLLATMAVIVMLSRRR
jgi:hypothetical protein